MKNKTVNKKEISFTKEEMERMAKTYMDSGLKWLREILKGTDIEIISAKRINGKEKHR